MRSIGVVNGCVRVTMSAPWVTLTKIGRSHDDVNLATALEHRVNGEMCLSVCHDCTNDDDVVVLAL